VARNTSERRLFLVGHSTGGSVGLIYLLSMQDSPIGGMIIIGSPLTSPQPCDAIFSDLALAKRSLATPLARFPAMTVNVANEAPSGWESLFYNPSNMDPAQLDVLRCHASERIPEGVADQFLRMVSTGRLASPDKTRTYIEELAAVHSPLLAVCGKADNLAPPITLREIFEKASSSDKRFRLFCRANGDGADFGNLDLICGGNVQTTVFPEIAAWLKERAGNSTAAAP